MKGPAGTTVVRLSLWMLVSASLAMSLVQPANAGAADNPEITDPAGDGNFPPDPALGERDIQAVWVDDAIIEISGVGPGIKFNIKTADFDHFTTFLAFHERMRIAFVPSAGLAAGAVEAYVYIRPSVPQPPATGEVATCRFGFAAVAGGSQDINTEGTGVAAFEATIYSCAIPLSAFPGFDPAAGGKLTGLYAKFELVARGPVSGNPATEPIAPRILTTYDTAPNTGVGRDWPAGGVQNNGTGNATDADGDGLNDTCEQRYFGNLTAENATGDPDGDGLTNLEECDLGTDPTKADTDGDGVNDKDDPFPLDPDNGAGSNGTSSSSSSGSGSRSNTNSTTGGSRSSSSGPGTATSDDKCADSDTSDAADCLQSDLGYLGMSAGGFLAVLVLCIVALATRWSL